MPLPEACASILLYYFSVLNVDTEWQAVHWMVVFPVAGLLWTWALVFTARYARATTPLFDQTALTLTAGSIPIAIVGPWMAIVAARTDDGLSSQRMIDVALRHGFVTPADWLSPTFFALGAAGLAWQFLACRRLFGLQTGRTILHMLLAAVALVAASCVFGAAAGVPLRLVFE